MKLSIIGGGQLGRMLALAAHPLGITVQVLEPKQGSSAGRVAEHLTAAYDDREALARVADHADAVTYEFENVPVDAARWLAGRVPVRPGPDALAEAQDRLREKRHFQELTIPTAPFAVVDGPGDLRAALERLGSPVLAKTRRWGYDGKGQRLMRSPDEAERVWRELGERPLIAEGFVEFDRELSILAVRALDGTTRFYPLVQNEHRDGILRRSTAPAPDVPAAMQEEAEEYARRVLESVDYVGVLAIEWFDVGGALLANEMAPRVHNSGHYSIEGSETSQFENHVRAVCGLPLGPTRPVGHAVMVNLIGAQPPVAELLSVEGAHVHLYAKSSRPGRKIGHVTLVGTDPAEVARRAQAVVRLADRAEEAMQPAGTG